MILSYSSELTAIINDVGTKYIFSQILAHAKHALKDKDQYTLQ
jgi:hypothetical protein